MAIGVSTSNSEENANTFQFETPCKLDRIPRPLYSPRLLPRKRRPELELDCVDFSLPAPCQEAAFCSEGQPPKKPKLDLQRDIEVVIERLPKQAAEIGNATSELHKLSRFRGSKQDQKLEKAIERAMHLFTQALTEYALEMDLRGVEKADKLAEQWTAEHYEELKSAVLALLPWTGEMKAAEDGSYDLLKFQGRRTPRKKLCKQQLHHFRKNGEQARAWEALCAVLSAMASRQEKVWLEFTDLREQIRWALKNLPLCQSKRSARRQAAIRNLIPKLVQEGAGAFAESLIDHRSVHRVTLAREPAGFTPATSMTMRRMPLWDALKTMDDGGPLHGEAAYKTWCWAAGRQFALQDLQFGHENGSRKERMFAKHLQPDSQLRDLLRSKRPVVLLDTLAALAPREVCKSQGLSKIVRSELHTLFREAKARGEAVVFTLGSDVPHKLAEKVYLQPPLADYGMRCGCLRWRESSDVAWAREFRWDDRITLCLQMP
eukprot:TRINITY_DN89877_c0_g1_i1.p1 TRINITY_DN89877_c0_g1~~TRINITY_DN89877_c0_g1_i1.p1  ORF type:complete len:489 (+),score=89.10 TRINITY_DN89877_c0_g1_i1:68-1534(+)